ncbi:MAG: hypothetical protein EA411_10285 [Saprospirales bacterium]|nr:MAG: hypothetical protein EA411_10285 [Saprospirales bacterium]
MSPLRKPLFITNGCKSQYLRHQEKSFLNLAMATPAEYFPFFLDLKFFAHFHDKRVFGVDSFMVFQNKHWDPKVRVFFPK